MALVNLTNGNYSMFKWMKLSNQKAMGDWINVLKKIQLYVFYKRLSSALTTHMGSKWRNRKKYSM